MQGNVSIYESLSLEEIADIISYLIQSENDKVLLKSYQASYAALQGIEFDDFKAKVREKSRVYGKTNVCQTEKNVEHYLNDYKWKEVK